METIATLVASWYAIYVASEIFDSRKNTSIQVIGASTCKIIDASYPSGKIIFVEEQPMSNVTCFMQLGLTIKLFLLVVGNQDNYFVMKDDVIGT